MTIRQLAKRAVKKHCEAMLRLLSAPIKRTEWYHNLIIDPDEAPYPTEAWIKSHHEDRNYDIVNLGSRQAKWAFDYSGLAIKGMNWAQRPQLISRDYCILQAYHRILAKGGVVLIHISYFSGLKADYGLGDYIRYSKIIPLALMPKAAVAHMTRLLNYPILYGKQAIKATLREFLGRKPKHVEPKGADMDICTLSELEMEQDAERWISGWKRQFGITDLDAPLSESNRDARRYKFGLLHEMVKFCRERGYRPVFVLPPASRHLDKRLSSKFKENYVYSLLREIAPKVEFLDYTKSKDFEDDDLYFNSFFLNKRGRRLFTQRVVRDLGINSDATLFEDQKTPKNGK